MSTLLNIGISSAASAVIFVAGMNLPASIFALPKTPLFGSFTDISSATNLADFPATYNANLNKTIEVGTTSVASITTLGGLTTANALTSASALATIGTITTGTWSADAIAVAKGGTGTTSPSTWQVLLGNGANGITVASSTGTTGQFLTSNGAGAYPSWQTSSVALGDDYTWTGEHTFNGATTTNLSVTNYLKWNNLTYTIGGTRQASSTVLMENGSGSLSWNAIYPIVLQDYSTRTVSMTSNSTSYTIRQNYGLGTFSSNTTDSYEVRTALGTDVSSGTETIQVILGNGTASTTLVSISQSSGYSNPECTIDIFIKGATNDWDYSYLCFAGTAILTGVSASNGTTDLANGFNIVASSTSSSQDTRTGTSNYLRIKRFR